MPDSQSYFPLKLVAALRITPHHALLQRNHMKISKMTCMCTMASFLEHDQPTSVPRQANKSPYLFCFCEILLTIHKQSSIIKGSSNCLIPVCVRLVRTLHWNVKVISLVFRQLSEPSAKLVKMKASHHLIKVLRQHINIILIVCGIFP